MRQEQTASTNAKKRRKRRRRKPSKFAYFLLLLTIVLCAVAVCAAYFCKVDSITVVGKSQYQNSEIIKASGIKIGTNLFRINKDEAEERIEESLPFVLNASVKYSLPNKIKIEVTPAQSQYVVINGTKRVLTDKNLKILKTDADKKECENLITVDGVNFKTSVAGETIDPKDKQQLTNLKTIIDAVSKSGIKKITEINVKDSYQLSCKYDSRITISLGTSYNTEQKLKNAQEIIKNNLHDTDSGKLDVSTLDKRFVFTPA